jgi:hypothetical protein
MKLWHSKAIRLGVSTESAAQRRERLVLAHGPEVGNAVADAIDRRGDLATNLQVFNPANAHHVIPVSLLERSARLRMLVRTGWDFNAKINGVPLAAGFHGSHPKYTDYVIKQITAWENTNGNAPIAQFRTFVEGVLLPHLQGLIENAKASGKSLNEFFRTIG